MPKFFSLVLFFDIYRKKLQSQTFELFSVYTENGSRVDNWPLVSERKHDGKDVPDTHDKFIKHILPIV
ncbi:MAG: hypothetical protein KGI80_06390, partial [Verrucomicrobiota bacterium]|nr:hypothetical protein [Verrucomicrobiota bacterium]